MDGVRTLGWALGCLLGAAGLAAAQAGGPEDLAGTWRREPTPDAKTARYFRLEAGEGKLTGELLNPPEGFTCKVALEAAGGRLKGQATWTDEYGAETSAWDFQVAPDGQGLAGRSEFLQFKEDGSVEKGWENHKLTRVARVGLLPELVAGAADEPFGDAVSDLRPLAGGWRGPGGAWQATLLQGRLIFTQVTSGGPGARVELKDERGVLRGEAEVPGGGRVAVELAYEDGRLSGRAAWREDLPDLADRAASGWAQVAFERLARLDGGAEPTSSAPEAGDTSPIEGVLRRDDGAFLRVAAEGAEHVGVLSDAAGKTLARVRLRPEGGRWVGAANWDGVELRWELAATGEGGLAGRCEWGDAHDGRVVARGWGARSFRRLTRLD